MPDDTENGSLQASATPMTNQINSDTFSIQR